jgi:hypothetical protein
MRDLIEQLQADTAGLVALQRRAERITSELAEGRNALLRYEAELGHARLTSERDRETIEGLQAELERRESLLTAVRGQVAAILEGE